MLGSLLTEAISQHKKLLEQGDELLKELKIINRAFGYRTEKKVTEKERGQALQQRFLFEAMMKGERNSKK